MLRTRDIDLLVNIPLHSTRHTESLQLTFRIWVSMSEKSASSTFGARYVLRTTFITYLYDCIEKSCDHATTM